MQTDNKTLFDNISKTFSLAVHPSIGETERKQYLQQGILLRARFISLMSAVFTDGTKEVKDANAEIKKVNLRLKEKLNNINAIANVVADLSKLVGILDELFQLPFTFV